MQAITNELHNKRSNNSRQIRSKVADEGILKRSNSCHQTQSSDTPSDWQNCKQHSVTSREKVDSEFLCSKKFLIEQVMATTTL